MKKLERVKVGRNWYQIIVREFTDAEKDALCEAGKDPDRIGAYTSQWQHEIVIRPDFVERLDVLLHELGHAIDYEYPVYVFDDEDEERAKMYADMIAQIVRDNPQLTKIIEEEG